MEHHPLLGDEKRPLTPPTVAPKDGANVDPDFAAFIEQEAQRLRQRQIRKRKCRRFFHFLGIAALFGFVLWMRHGGAVGAMSSVKGFFGGGHHDHDHDHDHPIHVPRGVTLLKCTNWDGQDDLAPSPDSPYPMTLPLDSLSTLFPSGNPDKANARGGCHGRRRKFPPWSKKKDGKNVDGLLPVFPRSTPIKSYADFTFPLNNTEEGEENKFFFISRGWWSAGRVNVFQKGLGSIHDDDGDDYYGHKSVGRVGDVKEGGAVKVHVDISYEDEKYLEYVKVCKIAVDMSKKGEDPKLSTGVGIFTPEGHGHGHRRRRHDRPHPFEVTIEFPETSSFSKDAKSKRINITEFFADLPLFSQTFGDLRKVYFEKLVAATANEPLESVKTLWGSNLVFSTVNAAIKGSFKAFKAVILVTKNAPIEADVELVQTEDAVNSTVAELITANGYITARTTLTTASKEGTGGNFTVGLATVNAPINLTFPSAPINNTLFLGVSTVLSPANVTLHPTYEGAFLLKTLLGSTTLNAKTDPEDDPEGKGRSRGLDVFQRGYGKLGGVTWWNEARKWSGHVKIESTLAPIVLGV